MAILHSLLNPFSRVQLVPSVQGNRGSRAGRGSPGRLFLSVHAVGEDLDKVAAWWKLPVVHLILTMALFPLTTRSPTMVSFKSCSLHWQTDTATIEVDTQGTENAHDHPHAFCAYLIWAGHYCRKKTGSGNEKPLTDQSSISFTDERNKQDPRTSSCTRPKGERGFIGRSGIKWFLFRNISLISIFLACFFLSFEHICWPTEREDECFHFRCWGPPSLIFFDPDFTLNM